MEAALTHLAETVATLRDGVARALGDGGALGASDDELIRMLQIAGALERLVGAVLVEATGEVARRSETRDRELRLTTRRGCRDVSELLQRATRAAPATVGRWQKAARSARVRVSFAGDPLPAELPGMREALIRGDVGVDGFLAVAAPLTSLGRGVGREHDGVVPVRGALLAEVFAQCQRIADAVVPALKTASRCMRVHVA